MMLSTSLLRLKVTLPVLAVAVLGTASPVLAETEWLVGPSAKYDALCLIAVLANDPASARYYAQQREDLASRLPTNALSAAGRVNQAFRDAGVPAIGFLGLVYSASEGEGLDGLVRATENPEALRAVLEPTEYWYPNRWEIFERVRPDLAEYFRGLKAAGYDAWWDRGARREVEPVVAELEPRLRGIDIAPVLSRILRRQVGPQITVHTTRYCRPYGTRVLGSTFLMEVVGKPDPLRTVAAGALHEMTHPPFNADDPRILSLIATLEADPTIRDRWGRRPVEAGYNTFPGYIDEDVTRAIDQVVGERLGVPFIDDADRRWREQENGSHMAAAVFYHLMKVGNFLDGEESVTEFLDRMHREGRFAPAEVKQIIEAVESTTADPEDS